MAPIRKLAQNLINQIAAGEVIERPASVVKELVENAIDAGATRIDVVIEEGGKRAICVRDDGHGIPADELELAVASHATSKLSELDQLSTIHTLGFRGEALASMGSVAQLCIRSRPPGAEHAAQIDVHAGTPSPPRPAAAPEGTTIDVNELFHNTPARYKFLKSASAEAQRCAGMITRIALTTPQVGFSLRHGKRTLVQCAPTANLLERIGDLFGHEIQEDLVAIEAERGPAKLRGYVSLPRRSRADSRHQYISLRTPEGDGRFIRDRRVLAAIREAYRGLLMSRRHPLVFLEFTLPADFVDVNVHPAKLEVRFRDERAVFSVVVRAIREALGGERSFPTLTPAASSGAHALFAPQPSHSPALPFKTTRTPWPALPAGIGLPPTDWSAQPEDPRHQDPRHPPMGVSRSSLPTHWLQLQSGYLILETAAGFEVIDPHAVHERILFERLRSQTEAGALEVQSLLVPEFVELTPSEYAHFSEAQPVLARAGIAADPFGHRSVAVQSYPVLLDGPGGRNLHLRDLVHALIEQSADNTPASKTDPFEQVLATMACKAAVKLGERLQHTEVEALLDQREVAEHSHLCPHGRPTSLVFTTGDITNQFGRSR